MAAFDKKQMDAIVSRFLAWKLPKTFSPDCWISFNLPKENYDKPGFWPVGTNLLTADEALAMLEHVLNATFIPDWSLLEAAQASLREHMAMVKKLRAANVSAALDLCRMFGLCVGKDMHGTAYVGYQGTKGPGAEDCIITFDESTESELVAVVRALASSRGVPPSDGGQSNG